MASKSNSTQNWIWNHDWSMQACWNQQAEGRKEEPIKAAWRRNDVKEEETRINGQAEAIGQNTSSPYVLVRTVYRQQPARTVPLSCQKRKAKVVSSYDWVRNQTRQRGTRRTKEAKNNGEEMKDKLCRRRSLRNSCGRHVKHNSDQGGAH